MRSALTVGVLVLFLLACAPPAEATASWAPSTVSSASVTGAAGAVIVSWTPGTQPADSYNVYGVAGDTLTLLSVATETSAQVPTSYGAYAVSGILNGVESQAVFEWPICPVIHTDPPSLGLSCQPITCRNTDAELCVICPPWNNSLYSLLGECWVE